MANKDFLLHFQEFDEDDDDGLRTSKGATRVTIDDTAEPQKQHKPAGPVEEDEESYRNDDKTELLSGEKKGAPFWTLDYYQALFNVDTYQVKSRIVGSMVPWPGKNFVHLYIRSNPDLYGPFWICATLVFAIAISGNISTFLKSQGEPNYKYMPEFRKVTMAATAIYSYAWLVPLALWGVLTWRQSKVVSMVSYTFLEIVCVYGYSLFIYIPAVVLWIIPYEVLRWCSILVALCLSGSVLVLTFWPAIRSDRPRIVMAVLLAVVGLHVLLAVGCKMYFFSDAANAVHLVPENIIKATPTIRTN
ncbi:protein YIPF1 [Denticeps clupeoides]|uniref:Protein YIPF n=1 Tax=Denticeps clupeoides TaxID=299321 RepID=A0AAY4BGM4_9TELE|nr:protein YIPF1 [Denticeps clupeoides]